MMHLIKASDNCGRQERRQELEPRETEKVVRIFVVSHRDMAINCDRFRRAMAEAGVEITREDYIAVPTGTVRLFTLTARSAMQELIIKSQGNREFADALDRRIA